MVRFRSIQSKKNKARSRDTAEGSEEDVVFILSLLYGRRSRILRTKWKNFGVKDRIWSGWNVGSSRLEFFMVGLGRWFRIWCLRGLGRRRERLCLRFPRCGGWSPPQQRR